MGVPPYPHASTQRRMCHGLLTKFITSFRVSRERQQQIEMMTYHIHVKAADCMELAYSKVESCSCETCGAGNKLSTLHFIPLDRTIPGVVSRCDVSEATVS
ncbi:hypothetical protein IG631_08978 [Alternaria alternata]|nr:hypothetical protein IG631_08978 [Alternaria alternata]